MKRTERHHLKENELAHLARTAQQVMEERRSQASMILIAVAVVAVAAIGYYAWRSSVESRAHALLAEALVVETARVVSEKTAVEAGMICVASDCESSDVPS